MLIWVEGPGYWLSIKMPYGICLNDVLWDNLPQTEDKFSKLEDRWNTKYAYLTQNLDIFRSDLGGPPFCHPAFTIGGRYRSQTS